MEKLGFLKYFEYGKTLFFLQNSNQDFKQKYSYLLLKYLLIIPIVKSDISLNITFFERYSLYDKL